MKYASFESLLSQLQSEIFFDYWSKVTRKEKMTAIFIKTSFTLKYERVFDRSLGEGAEVIVTYNTPIINSQSLPFDFSCLFFNHLTERASVDSSVPKL